MRSARLSLALETGLFTLPPAGRILVYRPRAGDDLSALPRERVLVVQGFRPDHDAFAAQGYPVAVTAEGEAAAALVCLPRSRAEARALLADAAGRVSPGGPVIVDGQKTDGIDALHRELRGIPPVAATLSPALPKAHGRIFAFAATAGLEGWAARPQLVEGGFTTLPGVFSADGPDRGSLLLAAALPADLKGWIVDAGAGWGYLSRAALARNGVRGIDLVEAEAAALDCARINIPDPRARFHWADATVFRPDRPADHVICNPPFHPGRRADPGLGLAFLRAAAAMLHPAGVLWLVANRHLPYRAALPDLFREVTETGGDSAFTVIRAARPQRRP